MVAERASHTLTGEERKHHACIKSSPAASSFGEYPPDHAVRGVVLAWGLV